MFDQFFPGETGAGRLLQVNGDGRRKKRGVLEKPAAKGGVVSGPEEGEVPKGPATKKVSRRKTGGQLGKATASG